MDEAVDRYFPVICGLEDELETIEKQILTEKAGRENIQRLYGLKRRRACSLHAVAPLLEAAGRLHGGRVPSLCLGTQDYFRDVIDHLAHQSPGRRDPRHHRRRHPGQPVAGHHRRLAR